IIGLSGAGKSTLLRCINLMHNITGGQLLVDDIDISKLKGKQVRRFRRRIGMILQSFNLVTRTRVLKNVLVSFVPELPLWRKITGIYKHEHKIKPLEDLVKDGILDKAFIRCAHESEGKQHLVEVA